MKVKPLPVVKMTDEELYELAKKRFKNGKVPKIAREAQRELWRRKGCPFNRNVQMPDDDID